MASVHVWFLRCPNCKQDNVATIEAYVVYCPFSAGCPSCDSDFVLWTKVLIDHVGFGLTLFPLGRSPTAALAFQRNFVATWLGIQPPMSSESPRDVFGTALGTRGNRPPRRVT